MMIQYDKETSK